MSQPGFGPGGFGYGGYRAPVNVPPPPPPPAAPAFDSIPLPPIYGPLRHMLNQAPPDQPYDQHPLRQTVRLNSSMVAEPYISGPGSESVVPYPVFAQMLMRLEQLESENESLLRVVMELNRVIESERGNSLKAYEHATVATSTALPVDNVVSEAEGGSPPPWRLKK